eukprot:TRINITY_DN4158_c0_g1_i4.p1 TRINITY_DN4158_c0_g1~~TRINITY_DN4158_c0_g1_i4.p1  ORF type:complete len:179 (-),score=3.59 TRINITY_DN4158_c0_g1_i4:48-584(-)
MQPGNLMLSGTISSQVSSPTALYYLPVTYNRALILNVSNSTSLSGVPSQLSALAALDALLDRPGKIVRGQHDALGNHPIPAVSSLTGLGRLLLVDNQASAIDLQPHCAPLFLRVQESTVTTALHFGCCCTRRLCVRSTRHASVESCVVPNIPSSIVLIERLWRWYTTVSQFLPSKMVS